MPGASIYDPLFRSSRFTPIWDDLAHLSAILEVEAALARATAAAGLIPASAAKVIASCCTVDMFDAPAIGRDAAQAGNLAIPLVKQLTELVRMRDAQAAGFVHWGATSQDIIDTAAVLQLRRHLDLIARLIDRICRNLASLTEEHRESVMPGRTWMQHAVPIPFALKTAGWLDAMLRHRERLAELRTRLLVIQFGGAAGTLASLGESGTLVAESIARELDLRSPDTPWHAARDRFAEAAAFHGLLTGTLGKIARDISLAMQTEIDEFREPEAEGRGGSSTMPQKQNPVTCAVLLAAAIRVPPLVGTMFSTMVQEQERGLGGWHTEWEVLPEICLLAGGALEAFGQMLPELRVDRARMFENLSRSNGLILAEAVSAALAEKIGRDQAQALVKEASKDARDSGLMLEDALRRNEQIMVHFPGDQLTGVLNPARYLGASGTFIDAVLTHFRKTLTETEK